MAAQDSTFTKEYLQSLFHYSNGDLYWKVQLSKVAKVGDKAGSIDRLGYLNIQIHRKKYKAHRIIFLMHHGYLPECIDHIDRNPSNNRIENLRPATHTENMCNSKTPKNNKSGVKGVSWHKVHKKWYVSIGFKNKKYFFGIFTDIEDAKIVAKKAYKELHGEFS